MTDAKHSKWSASGFEAVMLCPGKPVMEHGLPDRTSEYAAEGTAAHQVLTWALQEKLPASAFIGRVIEADGFKFDVTDDMARHVQVCVDYVYDLAGPEGTIFADIRVNYSTYLGVPEDDAWGTADVIVVRGNEIGVVDFKYGMGVEVSAQQNPQMSLYGLGALQAYNGILDDFERVRMSISQPRLSVKPSEYDCSVEELEAWGRSTARSAVISSMAASADAGHGGDPKVWSEVFLRPNDKSCKFCRAKATCPALRDAVLGPVFGSPPSSADEFAETKVPAKHYIEPTTDDWLDAAYPKLDAIVDWTKAVLAELERRLLAGVVFKNAKLVQGKRGNRMWSDPEAVEKLMKETYRLKVEQMYDLKLISPTSAEKLAPRVDKGGKPIPLPEGAEPPVIGPRQWPKLKALITQAEGKPHVAPVSDSRPALAVTPIVDEFTDVTGDTEFA